VLANVEHARAINETIGRPTDIMYIRLLIALCAFLAGVAVGSITEFNRLCPRIDNLEHQVNTLTRATQDHAVSKADIVSALDTAAEDQRNLAMIRAGRARASQIGLAFTMYLEDHNNTLPVSKFGAVPFDVEQDLQPYLNTQDAFTDDATQTDGFTYNFPNGGKVGEDKQDSTVIASLMYGPATWDIYADGHTHQAGN
jgi:hypothetical protein